MKLLKFNGLILLSSILIAFTACNKDNEPEDPQIPNEEELITSLYYILVDSASNDTVSMSFVDLDGDGGNDPVIMVEDLMANRTYNASVQFLNELEDPAEDITEEVVEEGEEHQVFYIPEGILMLETSYEDEDALGQPIGVETKVYTGDASNGNLRIILRHEPAKDAPGVSDGDLENAGGETDIEVVFPVLIL